MYPSDVTCFENPALGEKYYKTVHRSGLTVYVYPKKLSTAYVMLTTRYGSLEREFRTEGEAFATVPDGVAHFLEHKLFEEADGGDAFERFAPLGASANAFTSFDMTSYLFSTTDNLSESLTVLLDFVTHPYFTEKNVAKEQGIIAQEIGMCDDDPGNRLYYSFLEGLFQKHNIRVNIAGTVQSISDITPEILYRCYNTFYQLSNMALVVCGDTDLDTVLSVADATLPERTEAKRIECRYPEEDTAVHRTLTETKMSVATPLFAFGIKDLTAFDFPEAKLRYALLAEMLGKCYFTRSAVFYNRLYDEGLVSKDIGFSFDTLDSCAYFMVSGEGEDPTAVFERTKDLLSNISENLPSKEDFSRIKRVMYANYIRGFDSTESLAMALTDSFLHRTELFYEGDLIASITYEEFTEFATHFFKDKEWALSVIYPTDHQNKEDAS